MKRFLSWLMILALALSLIPAGAEDLSLDALMEHIEAFDQGEEALLTPPPDEDEIGKAATDVTALTSFGLTMAGIESSDEDKWLAVAGLIYYAEKSSGYSLISDSSMIVDAGHFNKEKDKVDIIIYNVFDFYPKMITMSWTPGSSTAEGGFMTVTSTYYTQHRGMFWYSLWRNVPFSSGLKPYYDRVKERAEAQTTPAPTATALQVGKVTWESSEDRQSIYLNRPAISGGSGRYQIAYNIYDNNSNPVNYFYSDEERVAATPGYGGLFNVFVVVKDLETGESNTQNIGWQELVWPYAGKLTVGKAAFEISPDGCSVYLTRPSIACKSGSVTIAYNIYDAQSNPVNYFYSVDTRVAATPGYRGKFNVFIVVTDTGTGEKNEQNIGWQMLGGPEPTAAPTATPVPTEAPEPDWYGPGQYLGGVDIPAGDYVAAAHDDTGYVCVSSDANNDDIIHNDFFHLNTTFHVNNGEYVELSRCSAAELNAFYRKYRWTLDEYYGTFRVGYDLEPGTYKLVIQPGETSGYYAIYDDASQEDIVSNSNWNSGTKYVTVKSGQFLKLSRCQIQQ